MEVVLVSPWALVRMEEEVEGAVLLQGATSVERAPSVWAALREEEGVLPWEAALDRFAEWVAAVELALVSFVPVARVVDWDGSGEVKQVAVDAPRRAVLVMEWSPCS